MLQSNDLSRSFTTLNQDNTLSEWISLSRSSSCRLHRAVFVGRAFGADGHLAHGRLKTPGNPWRGAQDPANGFSRWNGRDGRAPMQHRGRMGGFGICRSLIRSTAIALSAQEDEPPCARNDDFVDAPTANCHTRVPPRSASQH